MISRPVPSIGLAPGIDGKDWLIEQAVGPVGEHTASVKTMAKRVRFVQKRTPLHDVTETKSVIYNRFDDGSRLFCQRERQTGCLLM